MKKRRVDVILFNPAPRSGWQPHRRVELPLNLLYPATPLVHAGYTVSIIDQFADPDWKIKFVDALKERPLCFCVSSMTGPQIMHALKVCKLVKARYPDVPIIWGGIHASILPEQTVKHSCVDIVVVGEGEATLLELVKTLEQGGPLHHVTGIAYVNDGQYYFTGYRPFVDLNEQPPLAYHLINVDLYRRRIFGSDHVSVNSSRGCAHSCGFCYESVVHKRKWRTMQPKLVVERLKLLIDDYGIHGFNFTDSNMFVNMNHAYSVMEEIVRADLNIRIGKLHIRIDSILKMEKKYFNLLIRAGVERITIGVESGNQRILDLINKNLTVDKVIDASRKVADYSIVPVYLFMMGLPSETPEELGQSIRLAKQILHENRRASTSFNIYMPYPGTDLYNIALQHGLEEPNQLEGWAPLNYRYIPLKTPWISNETRKLLVGLDLPLMFMGKGHAYKKTNPIVRGLSNLYSPLARYRTENCDARFPLETKIVKLLGLFGRHD